MGSIQPLELSGVQVGSWAESLPAWVPRKLQTSPVQVAPSWLARLYSILELRCPPAGGVLHPVSFCTTLGLLNFNSGHSIQLKDLVCLPKMSLKSSPRRNSQTVWCQGELHVTGHLTQRGSCPNAMCSEYNNQLLTPKLPIRTFEETQAFVHSMYF